MELNSETIRTFRKNRTGGLRMNGLAKSTSSSFSGSTNTVMTEKTFKINRLRSSITGCQRRLFSVTTPFRWLNDELFQLRCWLGMERMSCVELADRRNTLVRLNVAVFALMAVWLICITSSSTSSRSSSSPESSVSHNVKHLESTVAKDASRVEVDPCRPLYGTGKSTSSISSTVRFA